MIDELKPKTVKMREEAHAEMKSFTAKYRIPMLDFVSDAVIEKIQKDGKKKPANKHRGLQKP